MKRRAVEASGQDGAKYLALSVDQRYTSAHKHYMAAGVHGLHTRDAWIVTSPPIEG